MSRFASINMWDATDIMMYAPPAKRQKTAAKKKKASNWFEKCTVDQLKQLCKAAVVPVSGSKSVVVDRLLQADLTCKFSYEYGGERFSRKDFMLEYNSHCYDSGGESNHIPHRKKETTGARRPEGLSNASLKEHARSKGLVVSGSRFDLVLRLLQHETSDTTGIVPKKAAGDFDVETGAFVPKPNTKSMKLPDSAKISERMRKLARPADEVTWKWSNDKHKYHLSRCFSLARDLIQKEIMDKKLLARSEEKLAWHVVLQLIRWCIYKEGYMSGGLAVGYQFCPSGMGRCGFELTHQLFPQLILMLESTSKEGVEKLEEWKIGTLLRDLRRQAKKYSIEDEAFGKALEKFVPTKE